MSFSHVAPLLLEECLKELGGRFERGPDWQLYAAQDGILIIGQDPQSSELVGSLWLTHSGLLEAWLSEE